MSSDVRELVQIAVSYPILVVRCGTLKSSGRTPMGCAPKGLASMQRLPSSVPAHFPLMPIEAPFAAASPAAADSLPVGMIGTLQATEAIKVLLGRGETLSGRLVIYDAMRMCSRALALVLLLLLFRVLFL